jgi:hypothetical protein
MARLKGYVAEEVGRQACDRSCGDIIPHRLVMTGLPGVRHWLLRMCTSKEVTAFTR